MATYWKTININKSWDFNNKRFKKAKTESSNRIIRVNDDLLNILSELKPNNTKQVFDSVFGSVPGSGAVNKVLRKVLKQAGISIIFTVLDTRMLRYFCIMALMYMR
ncbi:hypothetical protein FC48_GL001932 [Ligilactobacillus murinus DSM 20452 = NBRC 14221]|uniref:Uncharacterized protein n=1 Tax=Ligilactobacillus murinus DSM 20452 = NBRC 14221 TaxID=1423772 RepID=A0A0R2BAD5_9LACO|nr:hypothetical protein [Ligilactobacillus murinus]KRM76119.1 hypothetical protein FC48_GL001932 [Ligilactobacillus murinus DSM 20452 = NBRC 14221]